MVKAGNAGAAAPKLSNERCRAILSDPASDPEKARLAQETIDLRTVVGFDEAKIKEQHAEIGRLERSLGKALVKLEHIEAERAQLATLLEQARTELDDAKQRGMVLEEMAMPEAHLR